MTVEMELREHELEDLANKLFFKRGSLENFRNCLRAELELKGIKIIPNPTNAELLYEDLDAIDCEHGSDLFDVDMRIISTLLAQRGWEKKDDEGRTDVQES